MPTAINALPTRLKHALMALLALFVLNALLSMTNLWPTPFVKLDRRLSPEFVLLWVIILALVAWRKTLSARAIAGLAIAYMVLVFGRYFDTTAPALFGRDINLYWDAFQIPRVTWVSLKSYPLWVSVVVVSAVLAFITLIYFILRWSIKITSTLAAPYALSHKWTWAITAGAVAVSLANVNGAVATWPYISKPVLPTYYRQAKLLTKTIAERELKNVLPASPAFDSDLGTLRNADVNLFFIESYGRVAFSNAAMHERLLPSREAFAAQIKASGMKVVSAFAASTTFGGASELAHLALLSGINTGDPTVHDLLLTTERPTLVTMFRDRGYQTHAIYPGLSWDWPEKSFYRFDKFLDSRDLQYKGPKIGYWSLPDQYALASYNQLHPITAASPKRLTFYPSITSHMPFHPVPPYLEDWSQILKTQPFSEQQMAEVNAQPLDWLNMRPGYLGMLEYNFKWLSGYLAQPRVREAMFIVLGDHQPAANVTGEGVTWDVPIHIISNNDELMQRLLKEGFKAGLEPADQRIGALYDFTQLLVKVFDSNSPKVTAVKSAP